MGNSSGYAGDLYHNYQFRPTRFGWHYVALKRQLNAAAVEAESGTNVRRAILCFVSPLIVSMGANPVYLPPTPCSSASTAS